MRSGRGSEAASGQLPRYDEREACAPDRRLELGGNSTRGGRVYIRSRGHRRAAPPLGGSARDDVTVDSDRIAGMPVMRVCTTLRCPGKLYNLLVAIIGNERDSHTPQTPPPLLPPGKLF